LDFARCPGRHHYCVERLEDVSRHRLADGRDLGHLARTSRAAHAERPHLAAENVRLCRAEHGDAQFDAAREEIKVHRARALVRHVIDIDSGGSLEIFAVQMRGCGDARRPVAQLAGTPSGQRDQFANALRGQRRMRQDHQHELRDLRHPRDIAKRVEGGIAPERFDCRRAGGREQHRVAVRGLPGKVFPCDEATGTWPRVCENVSA